MKKRILSLVLAFLTVISLLPFQTLAEQAEACPYCDYTLAEDGTVIHSDYCNAKYAYDGSGDVGKYVRLIFEAADELGAYVSADPAEDGEGIPFYYDEFGENTIMQITDWYWDAGTTALWYRVELYSGAFPESTEDYSWPETPWIMQDYTDETYDWPAVLEFVTVEPPVGDACDICGQTHEPLYPLVTEPVIPEAPALTEGAEVTVVDGGGANVTGGVRLSWGEKRSLSAWSDLDDADGVSYRWQICYDMANDLWVDIQGQTGKGILISQAIVEGILDLQGAAAVRCVVTAGEESQTSPAIPVGMEGESSSGSSSTGGEDLQKVYVVVQYEYSDGRTAAAPHIAELTPGAEYKDTFDLNTIPGYAPVLENESSFGGSVTLADGKLTIDYAAGELTEEYTVIKVIYVPAYVSYTVIHYRQNVDNDNYTEHERETVSTTHKTGEVIADAHKSYDGFYNLLYETPAAAADGSTVVEVYYDRYYYLMKFDLGENGYGVDPIYARYGDAIEIGTPTRAGYTFLGWKLNGSGETIGPADMPKTMPATDETYVAQWQEYNTTKLTVMYWGENPNDDDYSVIDTKELSVNSGITLQYTPCEQTAHTHVSTCYGANADSNNNLSHDLDLWREIDPDSFESGYVYVTYKGSSQWPYLYLDGKWYNTDTTTYDFNNPVDEVIDVSTTAGTLSARKCKAILRCAETEHSHGANCCVCSTPYHAAGDSCGLAISLDDKIWTFENSSSVTVQPDGSSVLNVYFTRKEYTLRFYYAASANNKSDNTGNDITYYVVGGTTYYFGSWGNNSNDELPLLQRYFNVNGAQHDQCGEVQNKPVLNKTGYTEGSISDSNGYTYYYISFTAKYGANIYNKWPSGVFNSVYCYDHDWDNSEDAFVSAWNGEHHVYYSQHNDNQTIKGKYSVLDDNLLWDYSEFGAYAEEETDAAGNTQNVVDFLCFWENGADVGWSYPGLFRYHIYVKPYEGMDTTNLTSRTWDNAVYYFKEFYDTIDDSEPKAQTYPEIEGYAQLPGYFVRGDDGKALDGTFDANVMQSYDTNLYAEAYDVYFYYERQKYNLTFYNGNRVEQTYQVEFERPLAGFDYTPSYPVDGNGTPIYEIGSRSFDGWYTNAAFQGDPVDLTTMSMKAENLILYAKWEPVEYTVNYYLTEESLERGENIPDEMARLIQEAITAGKITQKPANDPYTDVFSEDIVKHGEYIPTPPDPKVSEGYEEIHPRAGYEFLGWFYINEDGDEAAFDPANMPVNQNLDLYAKWSSNKLCKYNVYFALDANGDGVADLGTDGKPIYVADPISGNGLAGHTYTFTAKGGDELYDPEGDVNYREGYFPHTGSHSITVDIQDEEGTGANSFTFLYRPRVAVPYTVQYVNKATGEKLFDDKVVNDNKNVVVTENFLYKQNFMPDAYQKTLVVTDDGDASNDVIIFYYTEDTEHALYVVNYYIQTLDDQLNHVGWTTYTDLQNTGEIGKSITVSAIDIDGFTLSKTYTDQYNVQKKENGATGEDLPSKTISELTSDGKLTGTLTNKGMELNFYYTRNLYPYEFRYMLQGTATQLADPVFGKAGYDQTVTEAAKEIKMDLDNDGVMEDYRLYDPTEATKSIHIRQDGDPLKADAEVKQGDAKINVATFYYVRCTQTMEVTKTVVDSSAYDDPDPNQEFVIEVLIHSASGYHQTSYAYTKSDGTSGTLSPETARPNVLRFTLKAGQSITIDGLPTAKYTVSEQDLPRGYYATYTPQQTNKLTVDAPLEVTVTNTYDPAVLEITKKVDVVEDNENTPEVENFAFTIKVPAGVTGSYDYTVEGVKHTETVADGKLTFTLKNGQTARFENVPVGSYTVEEEDYSARGYKSSFVVNSVEKGEGHSVDVQVDRGETRTVECINHFPVGHLQIEKTVTKEFFGTEWNGHTFTFTVERTTADRPLIDGNKYDVYEGETKVDTATVTGGKLQVTITFNKTDAAKLDEKSERDAAVIRTIEIRNLPAGTYKVTEKADDDYVQTPVDRVVDGLEIPAETNPVAQFANELIRPKGALSLSKELVAADGYTGELPQDTEFTFTFEATLLPPPDGEYEVEYKDKNGNDVPSMPKTVKMEDGKFTIQIKAGQTVTIENLPIDTYRITEATVPRMANAFYHNGSAVPAEIEKDSAGNLCTQIPVPAGGTAAVHCVNTYPVDNADLTIIHKSAEPGQIFVYEVKNTITNVIITVTVTAGNDGNGSTTIVDLPFGSYTVTQKNDWSWRYREEASDAVKTVVHSSGNTTVEFAQTWIDYWLGGCSNLFKNIFRGG